MNNILLNVFFRLQSTREALKNALKEESGQDLIEYALVAGLIAFGAVAAMQTLASNIGTGLTSMGSKVGTYTS